MGSGRFNFGNFNRNDLNENTICSNNSESALSAMTTKKIETDLSKFQGKSVVLNSSHLPSNEE